MDSAIQRLNDRGQEKNEYVCEQNDKLKTTKK